MEGVGISETASFGTCDSAKVHAKDPCAASGPVCGADGRWDPEGWPYSRLSSSTTFPSISSSVSPRSSPAW